MINSDTFRLQLITQTDESAQRIGVWFDGSQLRTDVAIHTDHRQVCVVRYLMVRRPRALEFNAKFVLFQTGGYVGMSLRIDIGINANRYRRDHAVTGRNLSQNRNFRL